MWYFQISSDQFGCVWQTTPDSIADSSTVNTPICDSGLVVQKLDLQCLECILDDPTLGAERDNPVKCTCSNKDYDGFESYVHDIYLHRLEMESKYHVKASLYNQPDVGINLQWVITCSYCILSVHTILIK